MKYDYLLEDPNGDDDEGEQEYRYPWGLALVVVAALVAWLMNC